MSIGLNKAFITHHGIYKNKNKNSVVVILEYSLVAERHISFAS